MNKFEIGDLVEGEETGKWVMGRVKGFRWSAQLLCVEVIEQRLSKQRLHNCGGKVPSGKGWDVKVRNAKLAKSEIVKQIINDL